MFQVDYDTSSCSSCEATEVVIIQITTSAFGGDRSTTQQSSSDSIQSSTPVVSTTSTTIGETTTPSIITTPEVTETTVCLTYPPEYFSREATTKVVYLVYDNSMSSFTSSVQLNVIRTSVSALFQVTLPKDTYFALSTFSGKDTGIGSYIQEKVPLTRISEGGDTFNDAIVDLESSGVPNRDVGAVIRDAIEKLKEYTDSDGSILYIITAIGSDIDSSTSELDIAQTLITNRIQLVVVEGGIENPGNVQKSLERLCILSNGVYVHRNSPSWGNTAFFTPVHNRIRDIVIDPIEIKRKPVSV